MSETDVIVGIISAEQADLALKKAGEIAPLLSGLGPFVQGAVLADLTSRWLTGWPPHLREIALDGHVGLVKRLVEPNERALFGEAGHPGGRN